MQGLFSPLTDLGPNALDLSSAKIFVVHGPKTAQLRAEVRKLCPRRPGIYGMIDRHGELIYVGKAKSLRVRLLSYFRKRGADRRAKRIIGQAATLLWESGPDEFAALHRELELIRRWRPRWNVQGQPLRRRYTHLCLGRGPAPYVFLSRRPPKELIACFGPIPGGPRAVAVAQRVNDLFQLRDCPQKEEVVFAKQTELFPVVRTAGCLRHEIATCLGPCAAACTESDYDAKVRAARAFLEGEDRSALETIEKEMAVAAASQQFERAANLRDRLEVLRWLCEKLERVRLAKAQDHFVYPVHDVWYLIHGGRTVAAVRKPSDEETSKTAVEMIKAVYQKNYARSLEAYEHSDGFVVVSQWFKRYPIEKTKIIKPEEALARCRRGGSERETASE